MSENFDRYTDLFLEEASEQIEELSQNLLNLEREGYDPEIINEIFRTAHTLKSSAAFVGLEDLSDLAHNMEDLLQEVKDEKIGVQTELVNLFFQCLDRIKVAVSQVAEGKMPDDTYSDLIESLGQYRTENSGKGGTPSKGSSTGSSETKESRAAAVKSPESKGSEEASSGKAPAPARVTTFLELKDEQELELAQQAGNKQVFDGVVVLDDEAPMRNMRFLLLVQNLKRAGTLYVSDPTEVELEELDTPVSVFRFIYFGDRSRDEIVRICQVDMVEEVSVDEHPLRTEKKEKKAGSLKAPVSGNGRQKTEAASEETSVKTKNIKVSSEKIDYLLNSVGELVITNSGLLKIYEDLHEELGETGYLSELKSKIDQAARIARDLQSGIMKTRMIPVELVFHRFSRPVRDLSLELKKEVDLVFKGEDTELDKNIIDALNDPLLHLIRNSLDHGVETPAEREALGKPRRGTLLMNAYQSGNNIYLEIKDDGRGLSKDGIRKKAVERGLIPEDAILPDDEIYNLIFQPGFSTAQEVTDVSGRGVGMNVVKKMVQEFKGSVLIQTQQGQGTSFILSFPLTLAIISAILVRIRDEEYAFPLSDVVETIKVNRDDITTLQGKDIINLRGDILPVFHLQALMGLQVEESREREEFPVVIANVNNRKIGFIVEAMVGKQEIVIKSLEQNFRTVEGLIGATLMGDGSIVMVLDVQGLLEIAQRDEEPARLAESRGASISATLAYNEQTKKLLGSGRRTLQKGKKVLRVTREEEEEEEVEKERSLPAAAGTAGAATTGEVSAAVGGNGNVRSGSSAAVLEKPPEVTAPAPPPVAEAKVRESSPTAPAPVEPVSPESGKEKGPGDGSMGGNTFASAEKHSDVSLRSDDDVKEALNSFEDDRERRRQTARSVLGKSSEPEKKEEISEEEYSRLYSVINTGMINAGFVLSQLLGITVEVSVPDFKTVDYSELKDYLPEEPLIGVTLDTEGEFQAITLLAFDEKNGIKAAADLMGVSADTGGPGEEDVQSVLSELTNIVGSSILNALANKTGLPITPTVPEYHRGASVDLLTELDRHGITGHIIYISADFYRDDMELLGRVFLLPSKPTLSHIVSRL